MWSRGAAISLLFLISISGWPAHAQRVEEPVDRDRRALRPPAFEPLPLASIRPAGWLKDQLMIQASGLSGHLDEFWPDIKESAWFGGNSEGWERVPYWLDGLVPLAYLLDDQSLKAKVTKAIDAILARQAPDGWLGPVGDSQKHEPYDVWPLFPLFKALVQYHEATGDARIIPALMKCSRKIDAVISARPVYSWAKMRVADLAVPLYWLYDRQPERWLIDLARKVFLQSHDWRAQSENFPFKTKADVRKDLENHGVNTAMGLKFGGVRYRLSGDSRDRDSIFPMLELLDRYHGQATEIFTCDEHLAGRSPSQGTELCTVVEAMYSLEVLAGILGDARLGDRLETLAFNALPATFKKDMTAHQYDQQCNQVICSTKGDHVYTSNGPESNLYGLEPNFGCCTANLHQGWPKFTSSLWMKSADGGLAVIAYAPCVVETRIGGKPVTLTVETAYPFGDTLAITVTVAQPIEFPLYLRSPGWAEPIEVKGAVEPLQGVGSTGPIASDRSGHGRAKYVKLARTWSGTTSLTVRLRMSVTLYTGDNGAVAIKRGPLVYALPIECEWKTLRDRPGLPFDDWEVFPKSPWNYALELDRDHPERSVVFESKELNRAPFSGTRAAPFSTAGAPVIARVKGSRIASWGLDRGAAARPPSSPIERDRPLENLVLVPYGCTDLRVTEFPTLAVP